MTKCEKGLLILTCLFLLATAALLGVTEEGLRAEAGFALPAENAGAEGTVVLRTVVDLNRAGVDELMLLPGVGRTLAERIIAWREENGGFRSVEDLRRVKGVGEVTMTKIYSDMEE